MITFVSVLILLISVTVFIQLISKMKIVGGNELAIIAGKGPKGFKTISGGRVFVIPLFHRFAKMDLTPNTIEVVVNSAIAVGIVPLNVKATVSFAISSSEAGRDRAVTRILDTTQNIGNLCEMASSIIEGHLRDAIASMTPEQVMQDKDTLIAKMIHVCKSDLENIGLEITTMNIADVDDHRLQGVKEPDLYIALLKRIQTASAETSARKAQAESLAAATEQQHARRAEVKVRDLENEFENLVAQTKVRIAEENQRKAVGMEEATRDSRAQLSGTQSQIVAEKERIEMLRRKYEAEITTPVMASKEKLIQEAYAQTSLWREKAQAEIDQLKLTLDILASGGDSGKKTYIIDNFKSLIEPFAETMAYFPVQSISVLSGMEEKHEAISAVDPHSIEVEKNRIIAAAIAKHSPQPA